MQNRYLGNLQTGVRSLRPADSLVLLLGLAVIYLWSNAASRIPVFTFGEWIRVLSPPLAATLLLVIVLIVRAEGFPLLAVSRPKLRGNIPFLLVVLTSCLLFAVGAISILNQFALPLALLIILAFATLVAVLIFSVAKTENALLLFFIILPILEMSCLNLRTSLHMKGSVLILPTDFLGVPLRSTPEGLFSISGVGHFAAMPSEVLFIGAIGLGFLLTMLVSRARWVRTPLDRLILGFVVVCLVSSCFSSDVAQSMSYVVEGIVIPLLLYYLIVNVVRTPAQLYRMLAAMLFFVVLGGLYQLYRIYEVTGFSPDIQSSELWTVMGSPVSSDVYAGSHVFILLMPIALVLCLAREQNLWIRAWALLAVVLGYTIILFNFQRGLWLAAGVQIVLLVIFSRRMRFFAMVLAPLGLFLGWVFGGGALLAGILGMRPGAFLGFTPLDESILIRLWTWGESLKLMIAHPLNGIGLGTFPSTLVMYQEWLHMQSAHHLFLGIGAEAGVIALLLLIAIFALVLKKGGSLIRSLEDTSAKNLILGMVVGITGYIIVGLSTGTWLSYKHFILPTLILWAVIGLIMAYRNYSHRQIRESV